MNGKPCCCVFAGLLFASSALAQIEVVPQSHAEAVFAGATGQVCITIRNSGREPFQGELHYALNQRGGSLTAPIARAAWKEIHMLPGQTVIECDKLSFPAVRSATPFIIQWLNGKQVIGRTDVVACPPDLLRELKTVISSQIVGAFDPRNVIKPLLAQHKIDYEDLERLELEQFKGGIVIAGPFANPDQVPARLDARLIKLGVPAVLIQPPPPALVPALSWYSLCKGGQRIVVAQDRTVANLADSPLAQLTLIEMVKTALHGHNSQLPTQED